MNLLTPPALWAQLGAEEVIAAVIAILFMVIPIVGQLLAKVGQDQKEEPPQRPPQPQHPARQVAPAGQRRPGPQPQRDFGPVGRQLNAPVARQGQADLDDEISDFLRQATQSRGAQPDHAARQRRADQSLTMAEIVMAEEVSVPGLGNIQQGVDLERRVAEHLSTRNFEQRAASLGGQIIKAKHEFDERIEYEMHHEVSSLAGGESAQTWGVADDGLLPLTTAADIAALLADPVRIRQAILVNEILQRPEQRWT